MGSKRIAIPCPASGIPKPTVWWYKSNGEKVSDDALYDIYVINSPPRYTWDMKPGTLFISRARYIDANEYTCKATNKFGSATASTQIDVRARTNVTISPRSLEVFEGAPASFDCEIEADKDLSLEINW